MILLFDIMDTVVYDPVAVEIPAFFGLTMAQLIADRDPSAWRAFEVNAISETECLNRQFGSLAPFDHDVFRDTVKRAYRWMDGMEQLLGDLHGRGVEMHALSNYSSWYTMIEERLQVSRFMAWTFVSFETKVRKPAPAAYTQVVDRLGGPASRFVFIDDREINCAAARAIGMHAVRFTGAQALRAELAVLGFL